MYVEWSKRVVNAITHCQRVPENSLGLLANAVQLAAEFNMITLCVCHDSPVLVLPLWCLSAVKRKMYGLQLPFNALFTAERKAARHCSYMCSHTERGKTKLIHRWHEKQEAKLSTRALKIPGQVFLPTMWSHMVAQRCLSSIHKHSHVLSRNVPIVTYNNPPQPWNIWKHAVFITIFFPPLDGQEMGCLICINLFKFTFFYTTWFPYLHPFFHPW